MLGKHVIKSWSKTQSLIALSSGESEFYAALKASAESLGLIAMLKDFGINMKGKVLGDASAALGIIHRKGLGRTRHIDTGLLWIQQTAAEKRLEYAKVLGAENPADLMTKYLNAEIITRHCKKLETSFEGGRATGAPQLSSLFISKAVWEDEEDESEEEQDENCEWLQLQAIVNEVWHNKWKKVVKSTITSARIMEDGEDGIPPLIKRPQEDIRAYAERSGLLKAKKLGIGRPRGPTTKSVNPMPTAGML